MDYKRTGARHFEPISSEVTEWRLFAQLAQALVLGTSRRWAELKDRAGKARKLTVFGQASHGNVCVRLIEVAVETCDSAEPHRHFPDLERLAGEVLKLCNGWKLIHEGLRHG